MIRDDHPLVPIANSAFITRREVARPSSEELCERLADLKDSREYRENTQNHMDEIQVRDNQIMVQAQQLQEKNRILQQRADELTSQNQQLQEKDRLLQFRAAKNASLTQQIHRTEKAAYRRDNITRETTSTVKPTAGRTRASDGRDPGSRLTTIYRDRWNNCNNS